MELNETIASLQDEVKLLKGEIKAILRDIRTAVLSENNPFAIGLDSLAAGRASGPGRSSVDSPPEAPAAPWPTPQPAAWPVPPAPQAAAPQVMPMPFVAPAGPSGPIVISAGGAPAGPAPQPPPGGGAEPAPAAEGAPISFHARAQQGPARTSGWRWSVLTMAGVMAWAEDAVAAVGPRRFRIILELACVAGLLPPDMRDVLGRVGQLAPSGPAKDKPMNVIECVVILHQLEAILQGETPTRLPLRRETA